jgi:O-antigen ligase
MFALEAIGVVLASAGIIPREAILIWTGLAIFYMIFSPVEDSLWLFVASIPLFAALPLYEGFDTLTNWRILILVLFCCLFFRNGISLSLIRDKNGKLRVKDSLKHYLAEYWFLGFLLIALLSFSVAFYKILALKKLIFLINIFLIFLITRNVARTKEQILKIWQAVVVGGAVVTAVSLIQFNLVLFVPLYDFWQHWAIKVILAFYGENLSHLLTYSNTWFAYYQVNPPTLRLFSVFPDSHSFAMFNILTLPIILALGLYFGKNKNIRLFCLGLAGLSFFGIVMSGSRGAWLSIIPVFLVALCFYFKNIEKDLFGKALKGLFVFVLLFVLSVGYPPMLYQFQAWQIGATASSSFSFFERARSISDLDEISNKGRLEIWQASAKSLISHPWLGVGLGNYVVVLDEKVSSVKRGASAHNLYLDFASEIGIVGVLFLVAMFIDLLYSGWLVFRRSREAYFKFFGLLFGLYLIWVLGYSFFDVVLLNEKVLLLFLVLSATLYNLRNLACDPAKILPKPLPFFNFKKK